MILWDLFHCEASLTSLRAGFREKVVKVFRLMQEDVEKQTGKKLLNIGSCGLHVIHNSFRDGCSAAEREVETFLSSVRWLFKDSPACHED